MNAQKKLDDAATAIRNLTIERDALKSKCEVQRKALAHEAMETAKLRVELGALKQAAKDLIHHLPEDEIELAREVWGNTNTNLVINYRKQLAEVVG